MEFDFPRFLGALGSTLLWSLVSILIATVLFEVFDKRYALKREIFEDNNPAAGILGASFVLGIFYTVTQIVIH